MPRKKYSSIGSWSLILPNRVLIEHAVSISFAMVYLGVDAAGLSRRVKQLTMALAGRGDQNMQLHDRKKKPSTADQCAAQLRSHGVVNAIVIVCLPPRHAL